MDLLCQYNYETVNNVLYFPYDTIVAAFQSEKIDIAFDENTPDRIFKQTTNRIEKASKAVMTRICDHLVRSNQVAIDMFFDALNKRLGRYVTHVVVIPLYGRVNEFASIEDAVRFLDGHSVYEGSGDFRKYEIRIEFSNADKVEAFIEAKNKVKEFLAFVAGQ